MSNLDFGLIGSAGLGAIAQEVVWLFNLRRSLDDADKAILRSSSYWMIMAVWVVFAALMSIVLLHDRTGTSWTEALALGAGLPLTAKAMGKAVLPGLHLGARASSPPRFSLRRYLRA